jgi:hypothetical protein
VGKQENKMLVEKEEKGEGEKTMPIKVAHY